MKKRIHCSWPGFCIVVGMLSVVPFLTGCVYHFKGAGLKAPAGVETIAVSVLENKTADIGLETLFTGDLVYEFTRSKILRVVGKETADAVLKGSIVSVVTDTISHTETFASDERRVTVTLDLILARSDGRVLWADAGLRDNEVFQVTSNKPTTDLNKRAAIEVLSKRLSEKAHNRILQDF
jgi:TolB-like protein